MVYTDFRKKFQNYTVCFSDDFRNFYQGRYDGSNQKRSDRPLPGTSNVTTNGKLKPQNKEKTTMGVGPMTDDR
jgi:hypothetical protein